MVEFFGVLVFLTFGYYYSWGIVAVAVVVAAADVDFPDVASC